MNLRDISDQNKISIGAYIFGAQADGGVVELLQLDPMVWMYADQKVRGPHGALMAQQEHIGALGAEIKRLTVELQDDDVTGDATAGALSGLIEAALRYPGLRPALAADLLLTRDALFKDSVASLINAGYAELGGLAEQIEQRVSASMWLALGKLSLDGADGADMLRAWLANARQMTRKDQQRSALNVQLDPNRVTRGAIRDVRNQWVRAVHALVALIEGSDALTDEQKDIILAPLREAERRAAEDRRKVVAAP